MTREIKQIIYIFVGKYTAILKNYDIIMKENDESKNQWAHNANKCLNNESPWNCKINAEDSPRQKHAFGIFYSISTFHYYRSVSYLLSAFPKVNLHAA